jgi:predicted DsbA family dithiol-disulfide isomerase
VNAVRLVVYSDFLCPWCWNAATRLASVQEQLGADLEIEWRSYLLRPSGQPGRSLEKFRDYTQSWLRVAEDEPRAPFQPWASDAGPPSHSVPPHVVAKAAAALGDDAGRRMRERLFRAYFAESRDITDRATLRALWSEAQLPDDAFASCDDPEYTRRVLADHAEAQALGATGVPAMRLADQDFVLVGAQPEAVVLRWLRRAIEARVA